MWEEVIKLRLLVVEHSLTTCNNNAGRRTMNSLYGRSSAGGRYVSRAGTASYMKITPVVCLNELNMDYAQHTRKQLLFANRILRFDKRYWDRRNELLVRPENETELALVLINAESHAFLRGIKSSIRETNLRAAGSLLRSLLESTANAYWITSDTTGQRATRYVAVTDNYSEYLDTLGLASEGRIPRQASNWTTSSAEDRLAAFSPQAALVWDYCSVFTHPSPTYMSLQRGLDRVLDYVIGQANSYALTTRHIMLDSSTTMFNARESRLLDKMAEELLVDLASINFSRANLPRNSQ